MTAPVPPPARSGHAATFGLPVPAAILLWLVILAVGGYVVAFPLSMFAEDTYFYLQIAANFAGGQGITFHGYTPTNGFHPLWFVAISAVQAVVADRGLLPYWVMALVVALAIAGFFLTVAVARRLDFTDGYVGLAVLVPYSLFTQIGSESALVVPLLLSGLYAFAKFEADGRGRDFALLHLALALCVLSRLDTVFVAALLGAASLLLALKRHGLGQTLRISLLPGAVHLLLLGGYLFLNWRMMGHLMPISGALKGAGGDLHRFAFDKISTIGWASFACAALSAGLLAWRGTLRQRLLLWPLYAGIALHAVYIACFTSGLTTWSWYYGAWVAAAALALAHLATTARSLAPAGTPRVQRWGTTVFAGFALALPLAWLAAQMPRVVAARDAGWARQYVDAFERNLPKNQGVFVADYPGALAYLGGYRVLPADGLVSDYAYQDEVRRNGILAYLRSKRIVYVMARGPDLDAAGRASYCDVLVHNATRLVCETRPDGGAAAVGLRVYAALNGQDVGVIPLARDHLAFAVPSLGFGVWRIDLPPEP